MIVLERAERKAAGYWETAPLRSRLSYRYRATRVSKCLVALPPGHGSEWSQSLQVSPVASHFVTVIGMPSMQAVTPRKSVPSMLITVPTSGLGLAKML